MKIKFFVSSVVLVLMFATAAAGQKRRQTPRANPSPTPTPTGTLSIEAGLVYESGDVKPVARTTFYLLDQDLSLILKPFGLTPGRMTPLDMLRGFSDDFPEANKLLGAITPHIIATATTDFTGKAKLLSLAPGERFLYGMFVRRAGQDSAWCVKVEIKAGTDVALTLDNYNRSP